jgi:hypothetical protein
LKHIDLLPLHGLPHPPQLSGSLASLTHALLQHASPAPHVPPSHGPPPLSVIGASLGEPSLLDPSFPGLPSFPEPPSMPVVEPPQAANTTNPAANQAREVFMPPNLSSVANADTSRLAEPTFGC